MYIAKTFESKNVILTYFSNFTQKKSQTLSKHIHTLKLPELIESININPLTRSSCEKTNNVDSSHLLNTDVLRYPPIHHCFLIP